MRRSLVRVAIILIAINAALAIVILLGGEMGDSGGRILGTSLLATASALVVMVQLPALSDRRIGLIPLIAIAAAVVGFVVVTTAIWTDIGDDEGWRIAASAYTVAVAGAIAAILSGLPIEGRSSWVGTATLVAVGVGAAMILAALWFDVDSGGYWRAFSVVAVLVAAGGLIVPILHRSSQSDRPQMAVTHCPFCGSDVGSQMASDASCASCGNRFGVTLHAGELSHHSSRLAG